MRHFSVLIVVVALVTLGIAGTAQARTVRGVGEDTNAAALGEITYLGNPSGYHFWFTTTGDLGPYIEGHSYHNVYKFTVDDPSSWCTAVVPDRAPYNLVAEPGVTVFYKIYDTTTDTVVCGVG